MPAGFDLGGELEDGTQLGGIEIADGDEIAALQGDQRLAQEIELIA